MKVDHDAKRLDELEELEEPDIVLVLLQRVQALAPQFSVAQWALIESEVRAKYGGRRVYVPKTKKHLSREKSGAVYSDGLSNMPTGEITSRHGISRATLYRRMKQGPRGGGS